MAAGSPSPTRKQLDEQARSTCSACSRWRSATTSTSTRGLRLITQNLRLVDRDLRADPEANRLFLEMLTSPKDPEDGAAPAERGRRVRPLRARFRPRRRADAVRHVPPLHGRRAHALRDRHPAPDRDGRADRRGADRQPRRASGAVAPRALSRGPAARHRQGARRRPFGTGGRSRAEARARASASAPRRPRRSPGWCAITC